jgi:hypothetical protein
MTRRFAPPPGGNNGDFGLRLKAAIFRKRRLRTAEVCDLDAGSQRLVLRVAKTQKRDEGKQWQ